VIGRARIPSRRRTIEQDGTRQRNGSCRTVRWANGKAARRIECGAARGERALQFCGRREKRCWPTRCGRGAGHARRRGRCDAAACTERCTCKWRSWVGIRPEQPARGERWVTREQATRCVARPRCRGRSKLRELCEDRLRVRPTRCCGGVGGGGRRCWRVRLMRPRGGGENVWNEGRPVARNDRRMPRHRAELRG
jgi:hypothetical protein